jgi:adenylyl-sulfate kinase
VSNWLIEHKGQVRSEERHQRLAQLPRTLWLTGLSGAGKSTLAFALERALVDDGRVCYVLDGDNIRLGLNRDLGFSAEDRTENIRRIAEVAHLMNDAGLIVIAAFICPLSADRTLAKNIIGATFFREVYVSTSLAVCESRDPKGMYAKARAGTLPQFTGISSPYEVPPDPDLSIDTSAVSVDDAVLALRKLL